MLTLVALTFLALGLAYFAWATRLFGDDSESALVAGSAGLVPGVAGLIGAFVGKRSVASAVWYGLFFAAVAAIGLQTFYRVLWPML